MGWFCGAVVSRRAPARFFFTFSGYQSRSFRLSDWQREKKGGWNKKPAGGLTGSPFFFRRHGCRQENGVSENDYKATWEAAFKGVPRVSYGLEWTVSLVTNLEKTAGSKKAPRARKKSASFFFLLKGFFFISKKKFLHFFFQQLCAYN